MSRQSEFASALLDPELETPDGLVDPLGRPAGKRFNVYRNNVVVSLIDAMETAFPVIHKLLGPKNFRNLSAYYVRKHTPESPLLMFYGKSFPEFLEAFEPLQTMPYLADVARLELARRTAYHATDTVALSQNALASIPPENLMEVTFTFAPSMQIIESNYPVVSIWEFNMVEGTEKPEPIAQTALISRPYLDLEMRKITEHQHLFLKTLLAKESLGSAYEAVSTAYPDFDLSAAIVMMLETQILTQIKS